MNRTVLVTGSAGLIGRQVVKDLLENGFYVYSCYNAEKPEFGVAMHLDITKKDEVTNIMHTTKPDVVIHLAAMTNVDLCEDQKDTATLINTKSTEFLALEAIKQNSFFIYMSTDYVFDGKKGMRKETDIPYPLNFYGKTKLDGENILKKLTIPHAIIRTSTPFGIHPKKTSFPSWVKESLESNRQIPVLVDQFTSPTFVPNLSKMMIEIAKKQITGTIHLAGATRISRYEFAKKIAESLGLDKTLLKPTKIKEINWKARRPEDSSLDVSKANETLDNKPEPIEHGLEIFIKQIRNIDDL